MSTIDRHIFMEWLKVFSLALGVTLALLLLEDMNDDLGDHLGYGAGLKDLVKYYGVLIPSFLPTVLPLSLMISILFSLGNLHRNNEIMAMHAAGLSLFRISRTLWLAGLFTAVGLFYLNAHLVPWSVEQARRISEEFRHSHELSESSSKDVGLIFTLTFFNHKERRLWFMNRFSEYTYRGYGITVSLMDAENHETNRFVANEGYYDDLDQNWVFLHGREITFDVETNEPIRSLPFDEMVLSQFKEDPSLMKSLEKRPKDLFLNELTRILEKLSGGGDPRIPGYEVRYNRILANPVSALIVVGLAIPFAVAGVRVNPMVGVSKSIGLFFAYYLVDNLTTLLGERGLIVPSVAAWAPNVIMLIVSLWLHRRAL